MSAIKVNIKQAHDAIIGFLKAGLVPMLHGSPGIGKSGVVRQIAKEFNLKLIDLRLSQCEPTDLLGYPSIKGKRSGYVPIETFPLEDDEIPEGYSGWLLFFDEFNSATEATQAASYKVVLDRMIGTERLHKKVGIVCAGNLETDNAIVNPMSTALQSRLCHLELIVDPKEFTHWADENDIDWRVSSYIKFKPESVYTFKPDHSDKTYSCPRTLEFASRILKNADDLNSPLTLALLAGTISEGVARELITFCKIEKDLPKINQIIENPTGIRVPSEPSVIYALTGSISNHATMENIGPLLKFVDRIPKEFQIVCMRSIIRRNKALLSSQSVQAWISKCSVDLFN